MKNYTVNYKGTVVEAGLYSRAVAERVVMADRRDNNRSVFDYTLTECEGVDVTEEIRNADRALCYLRSLQNADKDLFRQHDGYDLLSGIPDADALNVLMAYSRLLTVYKAWIKAEGCEVPFGDLRVPLWVPVLSVYRGEVYAFAAPHGRTAFNDCVPVPFFFTEERLAQRFCELFYDDLLTVSGLQNTNTTI